MGFHTWLYHRLISKIVILIFFHQCILTVMGRGENQMSAGYAYNNERLEIYPSAQGVKFMVIKK